MYFVLGILAVLVGLMVLFYIIWPETAVQAWKALGAKKKGETKK